MAHISIVFGSDRDVCGQLSVVDDNGRTLCGPFAVVGRASSALAMRHGNPSRDPLLPYGDTPTGIYRAVPRVVRAEGRPGTGPDAADALFLDPVSGDAALAEANGRFRLCIQAAAPAETGALRTGAGSLRMSNTDMAALQRCVAAFARIEVRCGVTEDVTGMQRVFDDPDCRDEDPPRAEGRTRRPDDVVHLLARRRVLHAGIAGTGVAMSGAVSFFALDAAASPQSAQTAYPEPEPAPAPEPEPAPAPELAPEPAPEPEAAPAPQEPAPEPAQEAVPDQTQPAESALPDEAEKAGMRDAVASPASPATGVQTNPGADTTEGQAAQNSVPAPSAPASSNTLDALKSAPSSGTNNLFDGGQGGTSNAYPAAVTQAPAVSTPTVPVPVSPDLQQRLDADPAYAKYDAAARQLAADAQKASANAAQLQKQYFSTPDNSPDKQAQLMAASAAKDLAERLQSQRLQAEAMKKIEEDRVKGPPILLPKKNP